MTENLTSPTTDAHVHYTWWSKRTRQNGDLHTDLMLGVGEEKIASFTEKLSKSFTTEASVDGNTWSLTFDIDGQAQAVLPDGRVFTANPGPKGFKRAKNIAIDMSGVIMTAVNEDKSNWIIDDANSAKVAQFSGTNSGVRKAILEFENHVTVPHEQEIFLSWVARKLLEAKLLGSSWRLTLFLLVLAPIILFFAIT